MIKKICGKDYELIPNPPKQKGCENCAFNLTPKKYKNADCIYPLKFEELFCVWHNGIFKEIEQ